MDGRRRESPRTFGSDLSEFLGESNTSSPGIGCVWVEADVCEAGQTAGRVRATRQSLWVMGDRSLGKWGAKLVPWFSVGPAGATIVK